MAEEQVPIEFDQNFKVETDQLLSTILTNVKGFSGSVSDLVENLVNFFTLTKFYLQAVRDPIALVLIPALDALINSLEDLKNIGFGTLAVWPWEVGRLESGVNTEKVEEALTALAASLGDVDPKKLRYDPKTEQFLVDVSDEDKTETTFDFTPYGNISAVYDTQVTEIPLQVSEERKTVLGALEQVQNFLNPGQWELGDGEVGKAIQKINESFKFRTLTPTQFVDEVNRSFDDVNDPVRPVGTGSYAAFVAFFAFPTHHALRDLIQVLMDFFANFLGNIPDFNDDRIERIELGDPLVVKGLENDVNLATGKAIDQVTGELAKIMDEERELVANPAIMSDTEMNEIAVKKRNAETKKQRLQIEYDELIANGSKLEDKIYGFKNVVRRRLPYGLSATFEATPQNNYTPSVSLANHPDVPAQEFSIPMFAPGTLIQQGAVFNDFTAEVVEHEPIIIKNGRLIKNTVRIKSKRGNIKENTSESETPNSPPIVALNPKGIPEDDGSLSTFGIFKTGRGFQGSRALLNYPMFAGKISTAPTEVVAGNFSASVRSNSNNLHNVLPAPDKGANPIIKLSDLNRDIYTNKRLLNSIKFRSDMVKFVQSLSIGQPINHEFINPPLYSENNLEPENDDDVGFMRGLWDLLPGQGYTPVIKGITIDGKDVDPVKIEEQLFRKKEGSNGEIRYDRMRQIRIAIGRAVKSGEIADYDSDLIKVPGGSKRAWELEGKNFKTFNFQGGSSSLPNWKFKRIDDYFPIYGETIDKIISKIEYAKDFATGALKKLDEAIAYLEKLIEDFTELNEGIQKVLQFFTVGLDKMGFYSAKISGKGGIKEFKERLANAKVKNVNKNPVPEFQLKPVTTEQKVRNPITGDEEILETTTLKLVDVSPSQEEFDKLKNSDGVVEELVPLSELETLKYSGGFVLFGMGTNAEYLDKFLKLTGIKKRDEIENASTEIDQSELNTLLDSCTPFVKEIQIQQVNSNTFINSEASTDVRKDTGIKIVFDNNSNQLTDEQKQLIRDVRGDDFKFKVDMQYGSIVPNTTTDANTGSNVMLSTDDFATSVPLNFSVEPIKSNTESELVDSVILRSQTNLESLTNFKIKITKSILSSDSVTIKEDFISNSGFTSASTSVLTINFE